MLEGSELKGFPLELEGFRSGWSSKVSGLYTITGLDYWTQVFFNGQLVVTTATLNVKYAGESVYLVE